MSLVRYDHDGGIAAITFARPEAGNAMSRALLDAFHDAAAAAVADQATRAVLIAAEGRNFCVGGDVREMMADPDPAACIGRLARRLHEALLLLAGHDAPVIIAAQGAAAGAGFSLVAFADIVVAGAGASFATAYGAIGLTADGGATWTLPRLIGLRAAQEMIYLGRRLDEADAQALGLVTRVVDDAALADEARAVASRIAAGPTRAFGAVKRLLGEQARSTLPQQLDAEAASIEQAMAGDDAREGIAAFFERRTPRFEGR